MAHIDNSATSPAPARGLQGRVLDRFFRTGEVLETERVAARMTRVRIGVADTRGLACLPGQQIRIATGDPSADWLLSRIGDLRTYSVWDHDPEAGWLDLCLLDHGDGPGARWGRTVTPGQLVQFRPPEGSFILHPNADYHLFAGEETAAVAFGAMLRAIPAEVPVFGAIETATPEDRLPLPRHTELSHPLRGNASAASSATLLAAVTDLNLPDRPGIAYLAGEARTIQFITKYLMRERNWPRRSIVTKPFWTPGKRGME
ncbi:siderophore-interacting protein [Nocardia heshunensis]